MDIVKALRARSSRMLVVICVIGLLGIAVAGCGSSGSGSGAESKHVIGFVAAGSDSPFWIDTVKGAEQAQKSLKDSEVLIANAKNYTEISEMVPLVQNMISRGVNALVVPGVPQLLPVLKRATAAHIPIIYYADGFGPSEAGAKVARATVITNNLTAGEKAGDYIKELLHGQGTVAILDIERGTYPLLDQRAEGAMNALKGTGIKVVSDLNTECETQKSVAAMQNVLTHYPNVNAVFGACGPAALGAEQAIKGAHHAGSIALVGFDGSQAQVEAVEAGREDGFVAQYPIAMGREGVEDADKILKNEQVPAFVDSGSLLVTKANVKENASKFSEK